MKDVKYIIFRYLTNAEFFNINKPSGTEAHGGGQVYIDFPVVSVPLNKWRRFFHNAPGVAQTHRAQGPSWLFPINSVGLQTPQELTVYQRRPQSVCIAAQRITSKRENRVNAWRPVNGFPAPANPNNRRSLPANLAVYLVRTSDGELWAGWFQTQQPCKNSATVQYLRTMLNNPVGEGYANMLEFPSGVLRLDETDISTPFEIIGRAPAVRASRSPRRRVPPRGRTARRRVTTQRHSRLKRYIKPYKEIIKALFDEDNDYDRRIGQQTKRVIQKLRRRNSKAVNGLKRLYRGKCQITGVSMSFLKKDGSRYSEAHHLIPLGNAGADSPFNIIIINPLIHRMLHYANVSGIDINRITRANTLDIKINGRVYTIKWDRRHAEYVRRASGQNSRNQ